MRVLSSEFRPLKWCFGGAAEALALSDVLKLRSQLTHTLQNAVFGGIDGGPAHAERLGGLIGRFVLPYDQVECTKCVLGNLAANLLDTAIEQVRRLERLLPT